MSDPAASVARKSTFYSNKDYHSKNMKHGETHSTEVAITLLTRQPRVWLPAFPKVFRSHRDLLTALLRVWTEAWKCQSNPSCTSEWHASTTKNMKHTLTNHLVPFLTIQLFNERSLDNSWCRWHWFKDRGSLRHMGKVKEGPQRHLSILKDLAFIKLSTY